MPTIMFQQRFVPKIESGSKWFTIRKPRKRPILAGQHLSLRHWQSKPYASKQILIREETCRRVVPVMITAMGMFFDERHHDLFAMSNDELAIADGFANWKELTSWHQATHGLPVEGHLIDWSKPSAR